MDSSAIVAIVVAVISACVGPICLALIKHFLDQKDKKELAKEAKAEKEKTAWQNEVKGLISPVATEVSQIKNDQNRLDQRLAHVEELLEEDRKATILTLRCEMKKIAEDKKAGKELDNGDMITFKEIYKRYHHMGGNHYRDAVDEWGKVLGLTADELRDLKEHDDED